MAVQEPLGVILPCNFPAMEGSLLGLTDSAFSMRNSGKTDYIVFESHTGDMVSTLEGLSRLPEVVLWGSQSAFSSQGTRLALLVLEEARPVSTQAASVAGGEYTDFYTTIELYDVKSGNHWGTFLKQRFWDIIDLAYSTERRIPGDQDLG